MKSKNMAQHRDTIVAEYQKGKSLREIASQYDVAYSTIRRLLKKVGEVRPQSTIEELLPTMYQDYLSGMNFAEISRKYNRSYSTVSNNLMKKYQAKPRKSTNNNELSKFSARWVQMYRDGKSLTDISTEFGVARETVRKHIFKSGSDTRSYHESLAKYQIYPEYFKTLDQNKAYVLGMLMAKVWVVADESTTTKRMRMTIRKTENNEAYLSYVFSGWVDCVPKFYVGNKSENYVEFRNNELYDLLITHGMESERLLSADVYSDDIVRGFISQMIVKSHSDGAGISLAKGNTQIITDWLDKMDISFKVVMPKDKKRGSYIHIYKESKEKFNNLFEKSTIRVW